MSPVPTENTGSALGSGAIAGLAIGLVALAAGFVLVTCVLLKKRESRGVPLPVKHGTTTKQSLLAELSGSNLEPSPERVGTEELWTDSPRSDEEEVWI
jgi:hypothetical protein